MKNYLIVLLVSVLPLINGCLAGGNSWQNDFQQFEADVFMFTKIATRITLTEADVSQDDIIKIGDYLNALRDILVTDHPDFNGARQLIQTELPEKCYSYGFTIIDIIERQLAYANFDPIEDQKKILRTINAVIDGALSVLDEFTY